jgi:zinc transporter 1/2/3
MTVFTMFFIELMAARFDIFGQQSHDLEASDPAQDLMRQNEKYNDTQLTLQKGKLRFLAPCQIMWAWTFSSNH